MGAAGRRRCCPEDSTPPPSPPSPRVTDSTSMRSASATASATPSSSRRRPGCRPCRCCRAPHRRHRPAGVRRVGAHRRHRRPEGSDAVETAADIPITYVPARNTIFLSFALAFAEVLGCERHLHRRQRARLQRLPGLPPRVHRRVRDDGAPRDEGRRRGTQHLRIHAPLIDMTKAEIIRRGVDLGVDFAHDAQLLRPVRRRRRVRLVRRVPVASARLRRSRHRRPDPVRGRSALMGYVVKEVFATLQGEGFNTGRVVGVLPVRRLQPLDRPRGEPCDCDLPVLRHRLRRHRRRRAAATSPMPRRWPTHIAATWPAASRDASVRRLHRWRAAAATRRRAHRRVARTRASRSRSRRTAPSPCRAGIDWVCVSPKAEADLVVTRGDELKLVYPQAGGEPERYAGPRRSTTSSCSRWTGRTATRTPRAAIEYCLAHPQWRLSVQTHKYLGIP